MKNLKKDLLLKIILGTAGVLAIITFLLLGWKVGKVQFLGIELVPPETSTPSPLSEISVPSPINENNELGSKNNPIIWAFVPSGDNDYIQDKAEKLTSIISKKTGLEIQAFVPENYSGAIEAMCREEAQIGMLNAFSYLVASSQDCANVALVAIRFGITSYKSQIVTYKNSGIKNISDIRGKTFCRPDPLSTSGWIIPSIYMYAEGIDTESDLKAIIDADSHQAVITSIYNHDCDVGATYLDARESVTGSFPDVMAQVIVIKESTPIPNDNISFISGLPTNTRQLIVQALLNLDSNSEEWQILSDVYGWEEVAIEKDTFYDSLRQEINATGIKYDDFME